ncbi:MAG: S-layer homology domain-containing protein [Clostridia bacterium]|nr:S-layer homology domain-containing protein [Clostridia bacterium]
MKKTLIFGISAALAFNTMCVFANSDIQYEVLEFDGAKKAVEISDIVLGSEGELVSVSIANQAKGTEFSKDNTPDIFNAYILNSEGKLGEDIVFSESLLSGRYNIFVNGSFGQKNFYTIYRNEGDEATINLINEINSAASNDAIKEIVLAGSNMEILGIDRENEELSSYLGDYLDISLDVKTALGGKFAPSTFYDSFTNFVVCQKLVAGDADSVMEKHAHLFGTTYEEYSSLDSRLKSFVDSVLKSVELLTYENGKPALANLAKIYSDACLLGEIVNCREWSDLQTATLKYKDALELDTDDYEDIKDSLKYKVFTQMYDDKDDFSSLKDVKDSFEDAAKKVKKSQSEKNENSSSSSSGGGKLPSIAVDPGFVPPVNDAPVSYTPKFSDLEGHYSEEYVLRMVQKGVIVGYGGGVFKPDAKVTRAEFAKMICGLFTFETVRETPTFADVNANDWFYEYVTKLSSAGIINGYDGKFNPNEEITRQDAALICYKVLNLTAMTYEGNFAFEDSALVSDYAKDAVAALASIGVIKGSDNKFMPTNDISRGDSAIILCRLFDVYSEK